MDTASHEAMWERLQVARTERHEATPALVLPAPLVPARPAQPREIPKTALALIRSTPGADWIATTYAKGPVTILRGTDYKFEESLLVRAKYDWEGISALWVDGKFAFCYLVSGEKHQKVKSNAMKDAVKILEEDSNQILWCPEANLHYLQKGRDWAFLSHTRFECETCRSLTP